MKRSFYLIFIVVFFCGSLAAVSYDEYAAKTFFSYSQDNRFGFSKGRVTTYVNPSDSLLIADGNTIFFKYNSDLKDYRTDEFFFFAQIFSSDLHVIKVIVPSVLENVDDSSDTIPVENLAQGVSYEFEETAANTDTTRPRLYCEKIQLRAKEENVALDKVYRCTISIEVRSNV